MKISKGVLFLTLSSMLSVANATAPSTDIPKTNCAALAADKLGASKTAQLQEIDSAMNVSKAKALPSSGGANAKREGEGS